MSEVYTGGRYRPSAGLFRPKSVGEVANAEGLRRILGQFHPAKQYTDDGGQHKQDKDDAQPEHLMYPELSEMLRRPKGIRALGRGDVLFFQRRQDFGVGPELYSGRERVHLDTSSRDGDDHAYNTAPRLCPVNR